VDHREETQVSVDLARFHAACQAGGAMGTPCGIGTYAEKSVHAVLKRYYEPDGSRSEVRIGRYIADIVGEDGIIEIQTRNFRSLPEKLDAFLSAARVTLVYPFAMERRLLRVDGKTGEILSRRKAPRPHILDACWELASIRAQLAHPNIRLVLALLSVEEIRYAHPVRRKNRRGDNIPAAFLEELVFDAPRDYIRLLPEGLPVRFTSSGLSKAASCRIESARAALTLFHGLGVVARTGKDGNAFVYERGPCL
jgi:hypothetical protein